MRKRYNICTVMGLLLLAAAFGLAGYNIWSDTKAGHLSGSVVDQLTPTQEKNARSGENTQETYIPDYMLNPYMDMPEEEIDGQKYIGTLRIPTLSLELPVISEWSYPALKIAPCRYAGSAYLDNLIIAAHNYSSHFGNLKNLSPGDEITFTDMDGNVFLYEVAELETLAPYATEDMTSGDWDLTLFTCTIGGQSRVTVRCTKKNPA